jgi:hypothetical protein
MRSAANSSRPNGYTRYLHALERGDTITKSMMDEAFQAVNSRFLESYRAAGNQAYAVHHWNFDRNTFPNQVLDPRNLVPEELFCHAIMAAIVVHDGVTPAIERFASAVGIVNLSDIDKVSLKTGDDPLGYSAIPQFENDLPLASVTDPRQYTGSFPTGTFSGSSKCWEESCSFEVPDEVLASWPKHIAKPRWFQPGNRVQDFETFLGARDFHGAWLSLNSPGWSIAAAKGALTRLASAANDHGFSLLAKAWTSVAEESSGGY